MLLTSAPPPPMLRRSRAWQTADQKLSFSHTLSVAQPLSLPPAQHLACQMDTSISTHICPCRCKLFPQHSRISAGTASGSVLVIYPLTQKHFCDSYSISTLKICFESCSGGQTCQNAARHPVCCRSCASARQAESCLLVKLLDALLKVEVLCWHRHRRCTRDGRLSVASARASARRAPALRHWSPTHAWWWGSPAPASSAATCRQGTP